MSWVFTIFIQPVSNQYYYYFFGTLFTRWYLTIYSDTHAYRMNADCGMCKASCVNLPINIKNIFFLSFHSHVCSKEQKNKHTNWINSKKVLHVLRVLSLAGNWTEMLQLYPFYMCFFYSHKNKTFLSEIIYENFENLWNVAWFIHTTINKFMNENL